MARGADRPTPIDLEALLSTLDGWTRESESPGLMSVWTRVIQQQRFQILVPHDPEYSDYEQRYEDAVRAVSRLEGLTAEDMKSRLALVISDVTSLHIGGDAADWAEGVQIDEGIRLVEAARAMHAAAAQSAHEPKAYFGAGRRPDAVKAYLDRLRLGHTRRGSFVITVVSPVSLPPAPAGDEIAGSTDSVTPFERIATSKLAQGMQSIVEAAEAGDPARFVQAIPKGVSADLCEAVGEVLSVSREADVHLGIRFSQRVTGDPRQEVDLTIHRSIVPILQDAVARLSRQEEYRQYRLVGRVVRLDRPDGSPAGQVIIEGSLGRSKKSVWMELRAGDYARAIKAHDEERDVVIVGNIKKVGRSWTMVDASGLEFLQHLRG